MRNEKENIILFPLSSNELAIKYARKIDDNNIVHYSISSIDLLINKVDIKQKVKEYVSKELNIEIEKIKIAESVNSSALIINPANDVLKGLCKVKKKLTRIHEKSVILQYHKSNTFMEKIINSVIFCRNKIAFIVNTISNKLNSNYKVRYRYAYGGTVLLAPCHFLSVGFEEKDREKAIQILRNDLKILSDNDLILGNLSMPKQMELADTIGSGEKQQVIYCFPFINYQKLYEICNIKPYEAAEKYKGIPLLRALLGVQTDSFEGNIAETELSPSKKYNINEVSISFLNEPTPHELWLQNFEYQNKVLKKVRKS